ncbi:methyltransferase domain-containing protein [Candidatus Pseudothioglobus sp. Uisw_041]|jgi:predicted SAM-dependent methyltransferase|uniref:class I SAM-dependent methyltransferase n=1 Tax=Candidatus Pseudothioglobus sp. Uisw_041 TaxID=3230996 RepID=UPI003A861B74
MNFKSNLKELLVFELQSFVGRNFFRKRPILFNEKNYLNLGCGHNLIDGFVNADFFYKVWNKKIPKRQWMLDLRYNLECEDETFDGVYSEHTFEHLTYLTVDNLLKELHRTVKKGGIIRITVPDCDKFVKYYNGDYQNNNFSGAFDSKCLAMHHLTQASGHMSIWCFEEMKSALEKAGFTQVKEMSFQKSQDNMLMHDIQEREWETVYVEAKK